MTASSCTSIEEALKTIRSIHSINERPGLRRELESTFEHLQKLLQQCAPRDGRLKPSIPSQKNSSVSRVCKRIAPYKNRNQNESFGTGSPLSTIQVRILPSGNVSLSPGGVYTDRPNVTKLYECARANAAQFQRNLPLYVQSISEDLRKRAQECQAVRASCTVSGKPQSPYEKYVDHVEGLMASMWLCTQHARFENGRSPRRGRGRQSGRYEEFAAEQKICGIPALRYGIKLGKNAQTITAKFKKLEGILLLLHDKLWIVQRMTEDDVTELHKLCQKDSTVSERFDSLRNFRIAYRTISQL